MSFQSILKPILATSLAATIMVGGATAAFADGKGKGNGNGNGKHESAQSGKIVLDNGVTIILNFEDVSGADVEWALKAIANLASKQVFVGYEDGTFQPRKPISRIEAITAAVRLMGLGDKAQTKEEMNSNLNFKDAAKIKKDYPWAVGYVAVAAENDLFLESDSLVQPEKPADRLWATTLLVKAMKLSGEAKAQMNTKLKFKDADQIPAGSVGYVAVAVNKGLIAGYEDNTFRPNRVVTRAELAALLDRTEPQLPAQDNTLVTGKLAAAPNNNVLLIQKAGTSTNTVVVVNPNAFVYRNGAQVALSSLVVGDELKIRTYNNTAIFVEVTKLATPTPPPATVLTIYGVYKDITLNASGEIATVKLLQNINNVQQEAVYNVSPNVTITGGTLPATNKVLELKITNGVVTQIKIL